MEAGFDAHQEFIARALVNHELHCEERSSKMMKSVDSGLQTVTRNLSSLREDRKAMRDDERPGQDRPVKRMKDEKC